MSSFLVISCSHHPSSRSRVMARAAVQSFEARNAPVELIDLREHALPVCDGLECYDAPVVRVLADKIRGARGILLAVPVYNYSAGAAVKNLIELTGAAWTDKVVGFLCSAGGHGSYMAILGVANSLMLDFRTVIVPRFVYLTESAFAEGQITDPEALRRVNGIVEALIRFSDALAPVGDPASSDPA